MINPELSTLQKEAGISSAHYHAGMSAGTRVKVQNAWRSGAVQVCSLAAFKPSPKESSAQAAPGPLRTSDPCGLMS